MSFKVVIPARYGSTRLPGKPLADLHGAPMVVRVAERAAGSGADEVVVATDDERVLEAVIAAGHRALLTRADHPSGSDRVMEVADTCGWADDAVVVNVQGDEPLVPAAVVAQVAALVAADPGVGVATLCERMSDLAQVFDPNVVKVVIGEDGLARYFSRAPIPYHREAFRRLPAVAAAGRVPEPGVWFRHIGLYAYRIDSLRRFVSLPVGRLERVESLEQLRLLEHGVPLRVAEAVAPVPGGVDTAPDLERVREAYARGN